MRKLNLIAGLPRSGSTLLCNLLNMNPEFHATPTSYTIDVLRNIRSTFSHNVTAKTHNRLDEMENIRQGMKGFLDGFYYDKNVVFDKCRGWTANLPLIDKIMGHNETKIIWTYRDPVEIVSSIEKRYNDTILLENADEAAGVNFNLLNNRIQTFIGDGGIVAQPVWLLDNAVRTGYGDRILIVRYWDLTNNPQQTLDRIHEFIGEPKYQYDKEDFKDLKQTSFEFDGMYNYKFMHTIKEGEVKYKKHNVMLPQEIIDDINVRFSWLNEYVHSQFK
jgi:sulfotransferase